MVGLGPRDPFDIAGPRPLSAVVVRPLNFTVRGRRFACLGAFVYLHSVDALHVE